jgi:hypothetical protein
MLPGGVIGIMLPRRSVNWATLPCVVNWGVTYFFFGS